MLTLVGDDEIDVMKLPNGMTIKMDFTTKGDKDNNLWGWRGRISGEYRRIRLYDKDDNLISELIEKNPLYRPPLPDDFIMPNSDSKVLY
ncbi:MAG: hypothetical protein K6A34_03690 [Methanobrevibacter sp.]|nr:hypothetical protein [Methanobrevibacter sp.]